MESLERERMCNLTNDFKIYDFSIRPKKRLITTENLVVSGEDPVEDFQNLYSGKWYKFQKRKNKRIAIQFQRLNMQIIGILDRKWVKKTGNNLN